MKFKFGIIGCGNMARGILTGVIKHRVFRPWEITVYDISSQAVRSFRRQFKVNTARDVTSVFEKADTVLLAVKPQNLGDALCEVKNGGWAEATARPVLATWPKLTRAQTSKMGTGTPPLLITILAGVPIRKVASFLPKGTRVVRAMPNLGATVGQSFTAICGARSGDLGRAEKIFRSSGEVVRLPERFMDLITVLSGSGPAYFFLLMEMLAAEGMKRGLSKATALKLAVQTAAGASGYALASGEMPEALRKKVTSKGGTTEAAIKTLEKRKWRESFRLAMECALKRAHELGRSS